MLLWTERLAIMVEFAQDNAHDIESLCRMLDITYDDVIKCFPDKLVKAYPTYFPSEESYEEDDPQKTE